MIKKLMLLSMCGLLSFSAPAQACDGNKHTDCLNESRYTTIEACNKAIAKDRHDFHAWVDRAVLETQQGLDEAAASDFEEAGRVLDCAQGKIKIAKTK